jgi:hypothetical protein
MWFARSSAIRDIGVTMTISAHASLDEQRQALGKLGEAIG